MNECLNINYIVEIPEFPKYFVDILGNVYSEQLGEMRKLKPSQGDYRYYIVGLCKNGKRYNKKVHRLVAQVFIPNPENKTQVDHIDGCILNNKLENLRWVTRSENQRNICKSKINTSGILGVSFDKCTNCWRADWREFDGKRFRKSFSVNKYGENEAKQLAIDYRKNMEKIYYPTKERYD